jgi:hypothetical protein
MNWIFEIYGNTYKALALQLPSKDGSRPDDRLASPSMPLIQPIGFLLRR